MDAVTDGLDRFREAQILLRQVRGEDTSHFRCISATRGTASVYHLLITGALLRPGSAGITAWGWVE